MTIQIIYAHPQSKGHSSTYLEKVKQNLDIKKIKYEVIDLYKLKYDAILSDAELYSAGHKQISDQNLMFQNKIKESTGLIFIYPVWWGTMPAILKGFIDRVFTAGFAFEYKNNKPVGLLKGKAAILMSTGSPAFLYYLMMRIPELIMRFGILNFCGIKSRAYKVFNANKLTDKNVKIIERNVYKALKYLV